MASKSRKSSTNKGKSRTKSIKAKNKKQVSPIQDEVIILLALGFNILLMISNFGFGGFIGDAISSVLFGLFGFVAYIVPLLLFIGIAFICSNKGIMAAYIKVGAGVVLTLLICTFIQMVAVPFNSKTSIMDYYHAASDKQIVGGMLGGAVYKVLHPAMGTVGSFVIVIIFTIICIVMITEKAFIAPLREKSNEAMNQAKVNAAKRKEEQSKRKEERLAQEETDREAFAASGRQKRVDKHASGVSFDTTLKNTKPDIVELTPEDRTDTQPQGMETSAPLPLHEAFTDSTRAEAVEDVPKKTRKSRKTKESMEAAMTEAAVVEETIAQRNDSEGDYTFPPISLLSKGKAESKNGEQELRNTAMKLQETLKNFGVNVTVTNYSRGPAVTRYELQPEMGVKVSRIVGLADDIKLNLAAADIRIEAPIPGKAAVGIEVPNSENSTVALRDLLETREFQTHKSNIAFATGKDLSGKVVVTDIKKMPHLLIAGATGSGKSVCINTLIMSILYKANPEDVKLIMIDPKVVELSVYNGIPHLLIPVVTDPKKAAGALQWGVAEMTKRYELFAEYNVRDLEGYNEKVKKVEHLEGEDKPEKMPQIVIIVDELADLMMVAGNEVEEAICRLAQLARAAGIHLILATQRPSVNVITGLIKANMPSRIAFSVSSGVDSRTIIDMNGAEKLLGKGDMLFYPAGYPKPARVQGAFVSDKEVQSVVDFLSKNSGKVVYDQEIEQHVATSASGVGVGSSGASGTGDDRDVYFVEAGKFIIEKDKASIGMLQRVFKVGFNRAARIMDQLAEAGVVGPEEGTKPRKILMSEEEFNQYRARD